MDEKQLIESRNAKVNKMEAIINQAKAENRLPTDEENKEFKELEAEVNKIDDTLYMNEVIAKKGLKKVPETVGEMSVEDREVKKFENMIRGIVNTDTPTMPADGQVMIPNTIYDRVIDQVIEICPIFAMADRYNIGGTLTLPKYDKANSSIAMTYATEGTTADSGKVVISQIQLTGYLGRCLAKISKSLINNTKFDIVAFVVAKMSQAIALFIETELLTPSDPTHKIAGLSGIDNSMKVTSAATTGVTVDELMDTQDKVIDKYQGQSVWIMNRATRNAIRKLKDNEGQYLLNRDLSAKWGYSLLGKDVYCSDAMDTIAAGKTIIFYGDFSGLAVKISEAINMQVLNERYAEEHLTGILAFLEMDAKVADTQKISKLVIHS